MECKFARIQISTVYDLPVRWEQGPVGAFRRPPRAHPDPQARGYSGEHAPRPPERDPGSAPPQVVRRPPRGSTVVTVNTFNQCWFNAGKDSQNCEFDTLKSSIFKITSVENMLCTATLFPNFKKKLYQRKKVEKARKQQENKVLYAQCFVCPDHNQIRITPPPPPPSPSSDPPLTGGHIDLVIQRLSHTQRTWPCPGI